MAKGIVMKHTARDGKTVTWWVRTEEKDDAGLRKRPRHVFRTKKEAQDFIAQRHADVERGVAVDPNRITTSEYLVHWLETSVEPRVRPSTHAGYERVVRVQLTPRLGTVRLQKLTAMHVQQAYTAMLASANTQRPGRLLSHRSVRLAHTVLKMALKQAVRWRMVPRNVAEDVDPPKAVRPQIRTWNGEQARAFLAGTKTDHYGALWVLALSTGARLGELRGLRWCDVDLAKGSISIRQQITRVRGADLVSKPKTEAGSRQITLPLEAIAALREQLTRRPMLPVPMDESQRDTDPVFSRPDGTPLDQDAVVSRFGMQVKRLGLTRITFHGMRHTHATLLLVEGVNVKAVSARLGHSSIQITLDTYAHVLPEMEEHAADAIGSALFRGA